MLELPKLKYEYNNLEPYIDARTMEIHHSRHHAVYVEKLNEAIKGTEFESKTLEEIFQSEELPPAIRNNGGGHWNHSFFWEILSPNGGGSPEGELLEAINKSFGSFENFKEEFEKASLGRFGSGWAWLLKTEGGLQIASTPNQDNPLMASAETPGVPILGLDVWEHAYYLGYQNKRADYVKAFWSVVDWARVSDLFSK